MSDTWWWLSFADESGNLGTCVVRGEDIMDACINAGKLGINPGGEVLGYGMPDFIVKEHVRPALRNRLMQKDELQREGLVE